MNFFTQEQTNASGANERAEEVASRGGESEMLWGRVHGGGLCTRTITAVFNHPRPTYLVRLAKGLRGLERGGRDFHTKVMGRQGARDYGTAGLRGLRSRERETEGLRGCGT